MSALSLYRTPRLETVEQRIERGVTELASMQDALDDYIDHGWLIPDDMLTSYDEQVEALADYADQWGFDLGDTDWYKLPAH